MSSLMSSLQCRLVCWFVLFLVSWYVSGHLDISSLPGRLSGGIGGWTESRVIFRGLSILRSVGVLPVTLWSRSVAQQECFDCISNMFRFLPNCT